VRLALTIADYQVWTYLFHFLGDQSKLWCAIGSSSGL
jgi:hypothetical protein